jgi:polysaccharide export outer membrane protein
MRYLLVVLLGFLLLTPAYADDYLIGRGDVLEISVWGVPDMSRSVTVRPDGKITLPAIGDIVASEISPENLALKLAAKMKEYVKKPIVTVSVAAIRNSRIYFTGGGVSSVYDLTRKTTLLKLISELGGFPGADLRRAYLSRQGKIINADFYALYYEGDMTKDVELQADDIIFIPSDKLNLVYVLGAVSGPKSLQYYEGMKILDAILAAGGFTEFAKENKVYVIDKDKNKRKIDLKLVTSGKDVSENVELKPGDYVIVEESFF